MDVLAAVAVIRNINVIRNIVEDGADPNVQGHYRSTPLHFAARGKSLDIAELILIYGADPNAEDEFKSTPLHYAAAKGYDRIVRLLLGLSTTTRKW